MSDDPNTLIVEVEKAEGSLAQVLETIGRLINITESPRTFAEPNREMKYELLKSADKSARRTQSDLARWKQLRNA